MKINFTENLNCFQAIKFYMNKYLNWHYYFELFKCLALGPVRSTNFRRYEFSFTPTQIKNVIMTNILYNKILRRKKGDI